MVTQFTFSLLQGIFFISIPKTNDERKNEKNLTDPGLIQWRTKPRNFDWVTVIVIMCTLYNSSRLSSLFQLSAIPSHNRYICLGIFDLSFWSFWIA